MKRRQNAALNTHLPKDVSLMCYKLLPDTLLAICCPRINWCSIRTKNCKKKIQQIGL
jgi:hypothetical protein